MTEAVTEVVTEVVTDDVVTEVVEVVVVEDVVEVVETEPAVTETVAEPVAEEPEPVKEELSVFHVSPTAPTEVTELDDSPFGRRDAALTPLIVAAARKMKRVLADEQNDVLHSLRGAKPVRSLDELLPELAEHVLRYASAIDAELRESAVAGAASVDKGTKKAHLRLITKSSALEPAVAALSSAIVQPLRERLERAMADTAGDNADLSTMARAIYREWKTQRIDEHLDDVARMAFGRGALSALTPGTPVCWAVDPHGPDCPDAEDNALAGVVAAGDVFPTDHTCAPAHEGCRCMLLPAPR